MGLCGGDPRVLRYSISGIRADGHQPRERMTRHLDHAIFRAFLLFVLLAGAAGCDSGTGDALPGIPTIVLPADGATDQANALELRWNPQPVV